MTRYRIGVIGDIHANLCALDAAIDTIEKSECNELIFLGDILTYGIDVMGVVEKIATISQTKKTILLRGNHDAIYLSSSQMEMLEYINNLPNWIGESVIYTKKILEKNIFDSLPFVSSYEAFGIYFAHANPYGENDWRYINTDADHVYASSVLKNLQMNCGVFGHTHRPKYYLNGKVSEVVSSNTERFSINDQKTPCIVNAGSIGQPRSKAKPHVLFLDIEDDYITLKFKEINYNFSLHVNNLKQSSLSNETLGKLTSFFI
jgi:predicted phosphodiesterase